jgi:Spy/CpxP family protein refolding chaperone
MKKFHAFVVGGAIMTMAATAALSTPMAAAEGPAAGKGRFSQGPGMHRMMGGGAPLISIALKHQAELNLSPEQVANLEKIKTHYQDQTAPLSQQLAPLEREIASLLQQTPANLVQVKMKIEQSEKLRSELRYLRVEALENGKSVLSAQQRDQLKTLLSSMHRGFRRQQSQNQPS